MADNDYIGQIQNQRLNQQWSNSMNWSTPSWMRGGFKEGQKPSTQRFQPLRGNATLNWGQGDTSPRIHAFGKPKKEGQKDGAHGADNQWEENQKPTFLKVLGERYASRSSSRASGRSEEYEGSM